MNKLKQVIARIRPSVVQIIVSASIPGKPEIKSRIAGTGFFVAREQFIATAAHVITQTQLQLQSLQATGVTFNVQIPLKDAETPGKIKMLHGFVETPFKQISMDEEHDLALLKIGGRLGRHGRGARLQVQGGPLDESLDLLQVASVSFHQGTVETGDEVVVAGFPLSYAHLLVQHGIVAATPVVPIPNSPDEFEEIIVDMMVNPGNSGGPALLASNGHVIGVCRAYRLAPITFENPTQTDLAFQNSGLGVVTPSKYLLKMLEKEGLSAVVK